MKLLRDLFVVVDGDNVLLSPSVYESKKEAALVAEKLEAKFRQSPDYQPCQVKVRNLLDVLDQNGLVWNWMSHEG